MNEILRAILVRDLKTLRRELEAFTDERDIWKVPPGVTNSAGNLAMHLTGNIRHFIGGQLGGSGYDRNRDAEFNSRDLPRRELLQQVDDAIAAVETTMPKLSAVDLAKPFPMKIADATVTTGDFLVHLAVHLTYHLGQLDYHRRITTGEPGKVGAVSPQELSSATKT